MRLSQPPPPIRLGGPFARDSPNVTKKKLLFFCRLFF